MKSLFVILALALLIGGGTCPALADENDTTANYINTFPADYNISILNGILAHDHDIYLPDTRRNPIGVGLDLVVYQGGGILEEAVVETKYDFQNEETSAYLVGKVNLFKTVGNMVR